MKDLFKEDDLGNESYTIDEFFEDEVIQKLKEETLIQNAMKQMEGFFEKAKEGHNGE